MRSEIRHRQADEQQQIVTALTAERHRAQERWDAEIGSFEAAFTSQVKDLRAQQQANLEAAGQELLERQPEHQRFSKELLNQRFVQGSLARIGEYTRAHEVCYSQPSLLLDGLPFILSAVPTVAGLRPVEASAHPSLPMN